MWSSDHFDFSSGKSRWCFYVLKKKGTWYTFTPLPPKSAVSNDVKELDGNRKRQFKRDMFVASIFCSVLGRTVINCCHQWAKVVGCQTDRLITNKCSIFVTLGRESTQTTACQCQSWWSKGCRKRRGRGSEHGDRRSAAAYWHCRRSWEWTWWLEIGSCLSTLPEVVGVNMVTGDRQLLIDTAAQLADWSGTCVGQLCKGSYTIIPLLPFAVHSSDADCSIVGIRKWTLTGFLSIVMP